MILYHIAQTEGAQVIEKHGRKPLYPIGVVAELIGIHPRTLRSYEQQGLINPSRRSGKRFYSDNELQWLKCLRKLLSDDGLNIAGVKKLLTVAPCWSIRNCPEEKRKSCPAVLDIPLPCWEIKHRRCSRQDPCAECEVYTGKINQAMKMARSQDPAKIVNHPTHLPDLP
jgi:MerR family transcriptional regulator, heat shock protein HspR